MPTIPAEFICPITHEVMEEPVLLADGFVYEEIAIKVKKIFEEIEIKVKINSLQLKNIYKGS